MQQQRQGLTALSLGLFGIFGLFGAAGCSDGTEGTASVSQEVVGECTTTNQCKGMYAAATDCKNSEGGVCYCGSSLCSDEAQPPVEPPEPPPGDGLAIVGRIEAEEYVAFSDTTSTNSGNCGNDAVDMQTTSDPEGGGCNVGWTAAGETLDYLIASPGGTYNLTLRLAAQSAGKTVSVRVDGQSVGQVTSPSNGWQAWGDRTLENLDLPAGDHTIQVVFDTGATNFNFFTLSEENGGPTDPPVDPPVDGIAIPAKIEAEDFSEFVDSTDGNSGDCGSGPVDRETTSDAGGGCNVGWTTAGETLGYAVSSPGGVYDVQLRLASAQSQKQVSLLRDGTVVGTAIAPSGGWQSWQTRTIGGVDLPAGEHLLTVRFDSGNTNLNWLNVVQADTTPPPPAEGSCEVSGELRKWHRVELLCDGPNLAENSDATFLNRRMNVTFSSGSSSVTVPGHFAADGNAKDSGATGGSKWRAYFMPPDTGTWNYSVSFRQGTNVAVNASASAGNPVSGIDGQSGSFSVNGTNKSDRDLRGHGLLEHRSGDRYLRFAETGAAYVEGGADSPENLFGYVDFDNTTKESNVGSCKGILHSFSHHASDWENGDPTWKGGKGKSLIGLVNYLASAGLNAIYLVPMSVNGDGCDGHPWTDYYGNRRRFDVSKLDQWETVFSHMTEKGFLIHFVTQETENDQLLNGGSLGNERKLYYREMISRFGHHPALQWNLGEENTNTISQVKDFADFIKQQDPYDHPVVLHTFPGQRDKYDDLLGHGTFDGPTLQYGNIPSSGSGGLYGETRDWIQKSRDAGKSWVVTATEASGGDAPTPWSGVTKTQRVYWMYANVMAGGGGFEWYLKNGGSGHAYDLAVENQREFDQHWQQSGHLVWFFNDFLPGEGYDLGAMEADNGISSNSNDWVLSTRGSAYLVFLRDGGSTSVTLSGGGTYRVSWYNPRTGELVNQSPVIGSGSVNLGSAPSQSNQDWLLWVRR